MSILDGINTRTAAFYTNKTANTELYDAYCSCIQWLMREIPNMRNYQVYEDTGDIDVPFARRPELSKLRKKIRQKRVSVLLLSSPMLFAMDIDGALPMIDEIAALIPIYGWFQNDFIPIEDSNAYMSWLTMESMVQGWLQL